MKKITSYIAAGLLAAGLTGCSDFLEKEVDLTLNAEEVFSSFENTRSFLANIYTYLPDMFGAINDGSYNSPRDCMTDNALCYWTSCLYFGILSDSYTSSTHPMASTFWANDAAAIRRCNVFLTNAREDVVGNYYQSGDDSYLYDRYCAEARLLRAIFHFEMVSYFGDMLIIGDDEEGNPIVFEQNDPRMNTERTDAAEVLDWIASECEAVKDVLPFRYQSEEENWGRVNGAAAYALRSRALLYKASPLFNTNNVSSWWSDAAQAAEDFINVNSQQSNPYKLYTTDDNDTDENYYECFITNPYYNDEYILCRSIWDTYTPELYLTPCGFSGSVNSSGRCNPTQNFVDCYETINGLPIDEDPTYNEQDPYSNRDPRLEQTILHQGSIWGDAVNSEQREVDVSYPDGIDYSAQFGGTLTGYYTKKYCNVMSFRSPSSFYHACPIYRYGEILLNAAEAYNEANNQAKAYEYINQIRARVGMPAYSGMSQDELRERIRNERRIELVFEDHHWFDERRWMLFEDQTASSETTLPRYKQIYNLYGVRVEPDNSTVYNYQSADSQPLRTFNSPKDYFFPIPYDELVKLPNLGQNTGW